MFAYSVFDEEIWFAVAPKTAFVGIRNYTQFTLQQGAVGIVSNTLPGY